MKLLWIYPASSPVHFSTSNSASVIPRVVLSTVLVSSGDFGAEHPEIVLDITN